MRRAAMANMRPSWPLPSTPMVAPGKIAGLHGSSSARTALGLLLAKCPQLFAQLRPRDRPGSRWPAAPRCARRPCRWPSVATGTPPGICTIESSESSPFSAWLSTGTPSTGSGVLRGHHPRQMRRSARSGDDHFHAAAFRPGGVFAPSSSGVRCADTIGIRAARRTRSAPRPAGACVSQSDLLPMMMPTSGDGSLAMGHFRPPVGITRPKVLV